MLQPTTKQSSSRWMILMLLAILLLTITPPFALNALAEEAGATAAKPPAESALWWIIKTSGWIGGVLLLISIYFIATVMQLFMEMRAPIVAPTELMLECETLLGKRDFNGIYKIVKESPSELGQLIAVGMVGLSTGLNDAREAVDRQGEVMTVEMEKRISMLAVIGSLGPLIGLLGTLQGMIESFGSISTSEATQMKTSEVAGGISRALILTFEGVGLSVPAIYFFALFKNRISGLSLKTINAADEFIRRLHATAQKKPTEPPA